MVKDGTLRRRPRQLFAGTGRTRHQSRRRLHAVVRQAQRRRIRQHRSLFKRYPREVVVLKVQRSGAPATHALNVLLRHPPNQTVIIQKQALHPIKHRRQFPTQ